MADVITRLRVESNEYDNKIRRASQELTNMSAQAQKAGNQINTFDKNNVALARSLGKMQTVSTTTRGKISELSNAFVEASSSYRRLTDQERHSPFGRALAQSVEQLKGRIHEAKRELESINKELNVATAKSGILGKMGGFGLTGGMPSGIISIGAAFGVTTSAALAFGLALKNNIDTAKNFEYSMSKLSSLTGMVGEDLETLKRKAIELGSTTTQSASQAAEAMAIIGSKRPDLLSSAYALSDVTKAAITMSEAAGMDVPAAAESLSAALNIFQLDSSEATRVINVLAAGSKLGAANIEELGIMTFRAGGMAKKAGLSFEEFAAAAETIRPAFGSAEDAGVALNKFLMKLESKMSDQYKPSVVGFAQAMRNLRDAHMDSNQAIKTFTVNGVKAYDAIMANVDGLEKLTEGVTGTNIAEEQAAINVDNFRGSMNQLSSAWEGFNLAMNDSNGALKSMVDWLTQTVTWATNTFTELGRIKKKMDEINEAKGNGKQNGMDHDLARLRGSNYKEIKAKAIENEYIAINNDAAQKYNKALRTINKYKNSDKLFLSPEEAKEFQDALRNKQTLYENYKAANNALKEWRSRSGEILKGVTDTETETVIEDEDLGNPSLDLLAQIAKNSKAKTPQEKAAEMVEAAELDYAQTIKEADIRLEKGLDDELAHKKKELSAQERLLEAYVKAYATYADPKYDGMVDKCTTAYGNLAEAVATQAKQIEQDKERAKTIATTRNADGTADFGIFNKESVNEYIKYLKDGVQNSTIGTDMFNAFTAKLADTNALKNVIEAALNNGIDISSFNTQGLWDKILSTDGDAISNEALQAIVDEINSKLADKKISLNFATGDVTSENKDKDKKKDKDVSVMGSAQQVMGGFQSIVGGLENLGIEFGEGFKKTLNAINGVVGVLTGIGTIVTTISTLVTAITARQMIPFFANGGFTHAANGVITGSHFSGDVQPLLVNAGEGVINQADQAALWRSIKEGNFGGGGSIQSVGVRGTDLLLCLNNELRSQGKPTL